MGGEETAAAGEHAVVRVSISVSVCECVRVYVRESV